MNGLDGVEIAICGTILIILVLLFSSLAEKKIAQDTRIANSLEKIVLMQENK